MDLKCSTVKHIMCHEKNMVHLHCHLDKTTSMLHHHSADRQCKGFDHSIAPLCPVFESRPLPGRVVVKQGSHSHSTLIVQIKYK